MSDLIERQAAIDAAALSPAEWDWTYVKDIDGRIRKALEKLPSAQSEQKTGMWLIRKWGGDAKCSNCGYRFNDVYDTEHHDRYCRFCGSKMLGLGFRGETE